MALKIETQGIRVTLTLASGRQFFFHKEDWTKATRSARDQLTPQVEPKAETEQRVIRKAAKMLLEAGMDQ